MLHSLDVTKDEALGEDKLEGDVVSDPTVELGVGTMVNEFVIVIVDSARDADEINEALEDGDPVCSSECTPDPLGVGSIVTLTDVVSETVSVNVSALEGTGEDETVKVRILITDTLEVGDIDEDIKGDDDSDRNDVLVLVSVATTTDAVDERVVVYDDIGSPVIVGVWRGESEIVASVEKEAHDDAEAATENVITVAEAVNDDNPLGDGKLADGDNVLIAVNEIVSDCIADTVAYDGVTNEEKVKDNRLLAD